MNLVPDFDMDFYGEDEEEVEILEFNSCDKKVVGSSGTENGKIGPPMKKPKQKGPMDAYFRPNPEKVVEKRKAGKGKQATMNDAYKAAGVGEPSRPRRTATSSIPSASRFPSSSSVQLEVQEKNSEESEEEDVEKYKSQ
ncbi:hypothetical protein ACLOJK_014941 [Asimina triloba]